MKAGGGESLAGPSLAGQGDRCQSDHQPHTDGPSTPVKKPWPALTSPTQAVQTDKAQDGKIDLKQCTFFQVEVTSHSIELKKPKLPRFTANLIFRLFRFPSAHAYWPSYLDVCGDTAWYCCVHPGECFQLHSFVVHCACVQKSECVCLCVCASLEEATAASLNRSAQASSQAHLTLDYLTPEQGLCPYISPHPDSIHTCGQRQAQSATRKRWLSLVRSW